MKHLSYETKYLQVPKGASTVKYDYWQEKYIHTTL